MMSICSDATDLTWKFQQRMRQWAHQLVEEIAQFTACKNVSNAKQISKASENPF